MVQASQPRDLRNRSPTIGSRTPHPRVVVAVGFRLITGLEKRGNCFVLKLSLYSGFATPRFVKRVTRDLVPVWNHLTQAILDGMNSVNAGVPLGFLMSELLIKAALLGLTSIMFWRNFQQREQRRGIVQ